ncbi:hypothetical protein KEM52_002850 [Ascosphaera acerosa]|nr:hypothetical protein KEM52_002850 [Ascosphaera acerosa]
MACLATAAPTALASPSRPQPLPSCPKSGAAPARRRLSTTPRLHARKAPTTIDREWDLQASARITREQYDAFCKALDAFVDEAVKSGVVEFPDAELVKAAGIVSYVKHLTTEQLLQEVHQHEEQYADTKGVPQKPASWRVRAWCCCACRRARPARAAYWSTWRTWASRRASSSRRTSCCGCRGGWTSGRSGGCAWWRAAG